MDKPIITTIITCYNKSNYIEQAINSVLEQKLQGGHEIIIIDDCSTDGSYEKILNIHNKNKDKIILLRNQKNIGITKTWIKVCKHATGKYIARLDGDDYWLDDNKLSKQLQLLEKSKSSKWCNTDFNMIDGEGKIINENCYKNGHIQFIDNYDKMLIYKGTTLPSSWLVERKLMLGINKVINTQAVDDTFNISLELFKKNTLTHLNEPATVYRKLDISDSTQTTERLEKLYETQNEYLKKYTPNYKKLLFLSLKNGLAWEKFGIHFENLYTAKIKENEQLVKQYNNVINSKRYKLAEKIVNILNFILRINKKH